MALLTSSTTIYARTNIVNDHIIIVINITGTLTPDKLLRADELTFNQHNGVTHVSRELSKVSGEARFMEMEIVT